MSPYELHLTDWDVDILEALPPCVDKSPSYVAHKLETVTDKLHQCSRIGLTGMLSYFWSIAIKIFATFRKHLYTVTNLKLQES